jgi:hypothetical protein
MSSSNISFSICSFDFAGEFLILYLIGGETDLLDTFFEGFSAVEHWVEGGYSLSCT